MSKEEMVAGLKNAISRGSSLEDAIQSFINAGYNPQEVKEASTMINQGASAIVSPIIQSPIQNQNTKSWPTTKDQSALQSMQPPQQVQSNAPINSSPNKESGTGKVILLISILLFLVGVLLISLVFKEQILSFYHNLFG